MGTHFNYDCPFCNTRGAGFEVVHQWGVRGNTAQGQLLAICGICTRGMTMMAGSLRGNLVNLVQHSIAFPGESYFIIQAWPELRSEAPSGVPENVERFYVQGLENLHSGRWDAAGAMFRKTLDVATKLLSPGLKELNLYRRINELVQTGLLTDAMGDWSHEIRLDGNDAVHDEDPETEMDARKSQKFTEAFLTYAFSLPQLVAESRSQRASEANVQA